MPALLTYLIALCFLIGGGYGALNWLAAPDLPAVAARASPKAKSMSPPPSVPETSIPQKSLPASQRTVSLAEPYSFPHLEEAEVSSVDASASHEVATHFARDERDVQLGGRQLGTSSAEVPSDKVNPTETDVRAVRSVARTSSVPADIASNGQRPHRRQAGDSPVKRKLALMTLRTIQFDDGRRVTQLIPYRERGRALAFGAE